MQYAGDCTLLSHQSFLQLPGIGYWIAILPHEKHDLQASSILKIEKPFLVPGD
jgi:hypothetical protein